ncbi:MAG: protein-disulfide reductase DsbD family protein [Alphaproteobacteria bacterium]
MLALVVLAGGLLAASASARASASDWSRTEQTKVRLIAAAARVGGARTLRLGLEFKMKPGWKIYWRSPGDAGFPPRIDWSGSTNLGNASIAWPAPQRFTVLGFNTSGYKKEVVLPLTVSLSEPGKPARLRATVDYLTCAEICIPYTAKLALDLPAGPAQNSAFAYRIERYRARVPTAEAIAGIVVERIEAREGASSGQLFVTARTAKPFRKPDIFVEGPKLVEFGPPKVTLLEGGRRVRLVVPVRKVGEQAPRIVGSVLILTIVDGARAIEKTASVEPANVLVGGPAGGTGPAGFWTILFFALLGGLILNLMPCVLPVLSLKLVSVVGHGGAERSDVRRRFLITAGGIFSAFMVLAAAMVGLKSTGAAIGWGIQFQQSWFLVAMAVVVTLFAANIWGLFAFRLPGALADAALAAGGEAGKPASLRGEFMSGAFATLLATPCSAPFLGTAIGFALSRGPGEIFAVFAALAIGLAIPYFVVAALPGLATRMPKPGRWMVWLRAALGFALAATAVWLLSVLAVQRSPAAAWTIGVLLLAVLASLWMRARAHGGWRRAATAAAAAVALAGFAVPGLLPPSASSRVEARAKGNWRAFERAEIARLVKSGKTVFVDVTAEWCITCLANKRLVLNRQPIARLLDGKRIIPMVADWTRPDARISRYLASYGRYGIPFNIVYGPNAPEGILLPELLSKSAVLAALAKARGVSTADLTK